MFCLYSPSARSPFSLFHIPRTDKRLRLIFFTAVRWDARMQFSYYFRHTCATIRI
ncbi:hypothetical protein GK0247 [Geobacillus kaustophilus HTA426]|uniref:Uncharacterized protein n=1 Tax=Geobacillus kaustophilus (strain HTA426) TaxID=235909 RepID=Q5L3E8_GEOKA|nr:hypothetical protein GK0247 [Geobacillus kaustophilus HTA426]